MNMYRLPVQRYWQGKQRYSEKNCPSSKLSFINSTCRRSQWKRGLKRRSAAARLLRSWVRIPPGAWIFVCCDCCVLSGRGLCDELITRPEESYRLWCVVVCDLETSRMRRPWPALGRRATEKKLYIMGWDWTRDFEARSRWQQPFQNPWRLPCGSDSRQHFPTTTEQYIHLRISFF